MRRIWLPALCALLFLAGCSGLPAAREMGDMALLRTMGVDAAPAGVELTVSTGPRARGLQGEGTPALTLSAGGESLSAACLALQGRSDSYVFFGYVDQLLLGEELTKRGVWPVLDYFAQDAQLGLGVQMWAIRGANAAQAVQAGGESGPKRTSPDAARPGASTARRSPLSQKRFCPSAARGRAALTAHCPAANSLPR